MATVNEINIKTNFDAQKAIANIKSFSSVLDLLANETVANNENIDASFTKLGTAIDETITGANDSFTSFQKHIDDISTQSLINELKNSGVNFDKLDSVMSAVEDTANDLEDSFDNFDDSLSNVVKASEQATKSVDKLNDELEDNQKELKASRLGLEALKDNLGGIPVIGATLTRSLDGVEGSIKNVVLAAAPVAGIAAAFAGISAVLVGAYKQSEEFRNSVSKLGQVSKVALGPMLDILEDIGNALGTVINKFAEWVNKVNMESGKLTKASAKMSEETMKLVDNIISNAKAEIETLESLNLSAEVMAQKRSEIQNKMYNELATNGVSSIQSLKEVEQQLNETYAVQMERRKELKKQIDSFVPTTDYSIAQLVNMQNEYNKLGKELANTAQAYEDNKKRIAELNNITKESIEKTTTVASTSQKASKEIKSVVVPPEPKLSPLEELEKSLKGVIEQAELEIQLIENSTEIEEEKIEKIKNIRLNALQTQQNALTDFYKINGDKYYDAEIKNIADLNAETGKLESSVNKLGKGYDDLGKLIKKLGDNNKKTFADMQGSILTVLGSVSSITDSLFEMSNAFIGTSQENYDAYNQHIYNTQQELQDYLNSIREEDKEKSEEDYNKKMEDLDNELQKAIAAQDAMAANAIKDKMAELKAERDKQKEEEKIATEREETQKKLEQNIANAEYQKELAIWQNEVKAAETQKNLAIAQSVAQSAFGIAMAAVGTATSFAQGGLVGAATGLALSATIISSIASATAGIKGAVDSYEQVKNSPPQPPQFAIGTGGYSLGVGDSAIVGELGAETVRNLGNGRIAVDTAAQTSYNDNNSRSIRIENLNVYVSEMINKDDFINMLASINESDLVTVGR